MVCECNPIFISLCYSDIECSSCILHAIFTFSFGINFKGIPLFLSMIITVFISCILFISDSDNVCILFINYLLYKQPVFVPLGG